MSTQARLERLAEEVKERRSQGFIQSWSEEIKREAIFLAQAVGFGKTSKITKLHPPCLHKWKKEFPKEKFHPRPSSHKTDELQITWIMVQSQTNTCNPKQMPVAIVLKGEIEFKLFCKDLAMQIAHRIIL